MNHLHLIGYLGNDPEINEKNGTSYGRFSLAVTHSYKPKEGERQEHTDWIPVVAFNGLARTLTQLQTGARVAVSGRLSVKSYEKDGERRTSFSVVASEITFLTRAGRGAADPADDTSAVPEAPADLGDDDIPF